MQASFQMYHRELMQLDLGLMLVIFSPLEESRNDHVQLRNADWQALIGSHSQSPDSRPVKNDYIDYSELGPTFNITEALKNTHKLNPSTIPNALRQWLTIGFLFCFQCL